MYLTFNHNHTECLLPRNVTEYLYLQYLLFTYTLGEMLQYESQDFIVGFYSGTVVKLVNMQYCCRQL